MWVSIATPPPAGQTMRGPSNFLVDVATSGTVCGSGVTYNWVNKQPPFQPKGDSGDNNVGQPSGDIGLYRDANGIAYLLSEDRGDGVNNTNSKGLYIYQLKSDYTEIDTTATGTDQGVVKHFGDDFEAPALFNRAGTYYVFASYKTGMVPNDNQYITTTAKSLTDSDTWSSWLPLVPTPSGQPDPVTCISQTMYVLPVTGNKQTTYIYMGDRWDTSHVADSSYVWLPISFDGSKAPPTPSIDCNNLNWSINTLTGESDQLANAFFTLTSLDGGNVMEVPSPGIVNDPVDLSAGNGQTGQQWEIVPVNYPIPKPVPATYVPYYWFINVGSGGVLQASSLSAGAALEQAVADQNFGSTTAMEQEWEFVSEPNGSQTSLALVNAAPGMAAEANGTAVDQQALDPSTTGQSQLWALSEVPGYWAITSAGNVENTSGTPWFGSLASSHLTDIVGFVPTPDGSGYWMIESGGKVTNFGDAANFGNITTTAGCPLAGATADPGPAGGFWAFDQCGGVFGYGGAQPIAGQTIPGGATIEGLAATQDGLGYWLIDKSGTVYEFGETGSGTFGLPNSPACTIASAITDPTGGFWALTICGSVLGGGTAHSLGGHNTGPTDFTKLAATPDGGGYWLFEQTAGGVNVYHFGDATEETNVGLTGTLVATVGDPNP